MSACTDIVILLDEYVDGTLAPAELARVEDHLPDCPACRAELEAIRDLLADARRLPRSVSPERELWNGIEARLGAAREAPARGVIGDWPARDLFRVPHGTVWSMATRIAAAIGLVLLGGTVATAWQHHSYPSAFAAEQARYTAASAALTERLAREPTILSPTTRAVVERNLSIVDAAIHEAEAALAADPGSQALEQMLVARYEQRLDLLKRATASDRRES